ncbi:MAG: D-sedoheptulose 7-phosphate isomerase [Saprospiraceae bacterium]|jgi:D-sedoheptulose 7-phosphate isomerase|nr:D-sedoheptulose 7-phosphate isomerase [Saprospiraceae bacterium]
MHTTIQSVIADSIATKQQLLADESLLQKINEVVDLSIACYKNGGKILFCGNGGSAADAQHIAAELSGRFYFDRPPLFAEALHVNTSYLTAVGNDYGYDEVFARMVRAMGKEGDLFFGLSTSGNSPNVMKAAKDAKALGMTVVGMTGEKGGKLREVADVLLNMPSNDTPRIQECHLLIGHLLCQIIEAELFPK